MPRPSKHEHKPGRAALPALREAYAYRNELLGRQTPVAIVSGNISPRRACRRGRLRPPGPASRHRRNSQARAARDFGPHDTPEEMARKTVESILGSDLHLLSEEEFEELVAATLQRLFDLLT